MCTLLAIRQNIRAKFSMVRSHELTGTFCWPMYDYKLRMMCYSVMTQAFLEKEIPSSPNRSRTYNLPITSSDTTTELQETRGS